MSDDLDDRIAYLKQQRQIDVAMQSSKRRFSLPKPKWMSWKIV